MAEELPGFIPRVLQRGDVSLLRADEAVLKAMVDGWRAQMLARGLATSTITARCSLIGRFKIGYAYGLRRRELVMLDLTDFGPNPHVPRFGDYGVMTVRWAKGTAVELLQYWCTEGRQRLRTADRSPTLWPSERRSRLTINALGRSFTALRTRAGLPRS